MSGRLVEIEKEIQELSEEIEEVEQRKEEDEEYKGCFMLTVKITDSLAIGGENAVQPVEADVTDDNVAEAVGAKFLMDIQPDGAWLNADSSVVKVREKIGETRVQMQKM